MTELFWQQNSHTRLDRETKTFCYKLESPTSREEPNCNKLLPPVILSGVLFHLLEWQAFSYVRFDSLLFHCYWVVLAFILCLAIVYKYILYTDTSFLCNHSLS